MACGSSISTSRTNVYCLKKSCGSAPSSASKPTFIDAAGARTDAPRSRAIFGEIADELAHNGFEAEPFGTRSVAVKVAPAGVDASQIEHMLNEIFEQLAREDQAINLEAIRARIAASIACHAAIKVNMPLRN